MGKASFAYNKANSSEEVLILEKEIDRKTKPDWIIHYVANGVRCETCGNIIYPYLPDICDAHTHGLSRYGGHLEFQVILDMGPRNIGYVLNEFGFRVRSGEKFKDGDVVNGIFEDCPVRLVEMDDSEGKKVLRVVIPDSQNRWPEDKACDPPYTQQIFHLDLLRNLNDPHQH